MARHRKYTFMPGTIGRFVKKHGITFDYLQVPPEMICRRQDHPGEKFFILTYRRPGAILKIPYSQGSAVRTWPTVEQSMESWGADILLFIRSESPEDLAGDFGGEIEDAEAQWEVLESLTQRSRAFLGPEAFEELVNMAVRGFELEGDSGWRRHRQICG